MPEARDIEVTIRITGDTGIPDTQVIAAINRLLDMPPFKIAEELGLEYVIDPSSKEYDEAINAIRDRLLPPPGRWKVVAK